MKRTGKVTSPIKVKYLEGSRSPRVGPQEHILSEASIKNDLLDSHQNIVIQKTIEKSHTFPNGDHYIGEWRNQTIEGCGVYTFQKQGLQYRGYFKSDKFHGEEGILLFLNPSSQSKIHNKDEYIYYGSWMNGEKHGKGKYIYSKDKFYDGDWYQNTKQGHGTLKTAEGQYVGQWSNDRKNGNGVLTMYNGNRFEGKWQKDNFYDGSIFYKNGDQYEGQIKYMTRDGVGKYYFKNGQQLTGTFQNDAFLSGKVRIPAEGEFDFPQ